ncbi:MAG: HDOD domain-containing protein, partial [Bdellovibrionota bacterium]
MECAKEILKVTQIPSIPETLKAIIQATNNPNVNSSHLEKLVIRDAGISLRLLKMVNSSYYSLPQRVKSIKQAIVLLGFSAVKNIASGLAMIETFGRMDKIDQNYVGMIWNHSLTVSRFTQIFNKMSGLKTSDDVMMAGMVHDIGHLIMNRHFESDYRALLDKNCFFPSVDEEMMRFSIDHAALGGVLMEEWKFAPAV